MSSINTIDINDTPQIVLYVHKVRKTKKDKKTEDILQYKRNYYIKNKTYHQEYYKKKFICGCGKTITTGGKSKHLNSDRHCEYEHYLKFSSDKCLN